VRIAIADYGLHNSPIVDVSHPLFSDSTDGSNSVSDYFGGDKALDLINTPSVKRLTKQFGSSLDHDVRKVVPPALPEHLSE
jgi:hypothetical protein